MDKKSLLTKKLITKVIPKKNKYNNVKTTSNGIIYDSKKEAMYSKELDWLKFTDGINKVLNVERQIKYPIEVNGIKICTYILDFKVYYKNRTEYVDVKGMLTDVYKLKKKLMKAIYDIDIKEV